MGTNNLQIEHQILVILIGDQHLEKIFPYPGVTPSVEAATHRFPFTIPLWQVLPIRASAQDPKAAIHEQAGIRPVVGSITNFAGHKGRDPLPLPPVQLVTLDPHSILPAQIR